MSAAQLGARKLNKKLTNWGQAKRRATKFRPKAVGGGILDRSRIFVGLVVPDNRVKFGDPHATNWWEAAFPADF